MSHFAVLVLSDQKLDRRNAEPVVTELLEPYSENGEWFAEGSRWDWWQIGGRWTGALTAGYDPELDPANIETCFLCGGSGERPGGRQQFGDAWYESCKGCNGCEGTGKRVKWPTDWREHPGDVAPVSEVGLDFLPFAVVTPGGKWRERGRMGFFGVTIKDENGQDEKPEDLWEGAYRSLLAQHPEATAVVVDCHA
jgi:hypothetical protein